MACLPACNSVYGTWIRNTKAVVPAQAGTQTPQRFGSITYGEFLC